MNFADPDEMDALAGEYVLGLLAPQDRQAFERELARNRALARSVGRWQDRLLETAPMPDPVEPAPQLWSRIARDLPEAPPPRPAVPGPWHRLAFWRLASFASLAAAVALAWSLFLATPREAAFQPAYVAVLQEPAGKRPGWLVEVAADRTVRLTPLARAAVGPGQAVELWTRPAGAAAPTSLGLVAADRRTVIPAARLPAVAAEQFFAVSLEPETGSPTGQPTGPVLAAGEAVRL